MKKLSMLLQEQFNTMCQGKLFRAAITGQEVWDIYLKGFEEDPIFRDPESSVHNCNHCKNFIRRYGNIVAVGEDNALISIFDVQAEGEYTATITVLSKKIKTYAIANVFFETYDELNSLPYESCNKTQGAYKLGVAENHKRYTKEEAEKYGVVKANEIRTFEHMHLSLPGVFVDKTGKSVETIMGEFRSAKDVFLRAMEEIPLDTLNLVKDLIVQGSLLDGQTHLFKVEQFIPFKKEFEKLSKKSQHNLHDNWAWKISYKLPIAKFKNELIGVLCTELAEGKELNDACTAWNKRVDPKHYMKATAPITKRQIEDAKKFVEDNGYEASFCRRFAHIDDIKVSEILHANAGDGKLRNVSIFDGVKSTSTRHKRAEFDGVEEVGIERFMKDILPGVTSIEAFLTNQQEGNMVSLTTANNKESKPIFRWNNNYSWTFNGNLAGKSQIKEAVKLAGGNVDGILNFRLAWNEDGNDQSDLDLWAEEPGHKLIGYSTQYRKGSSYGGSDRSPCSGQLDVDIITPGRDLAVENITWIQPSKMRDGVYKVWVNPFRSHSSKGFKMEIEFAGETYLYEYNQPVNSNIPVAEVTLKDGAFTIKHLLPEVGVSSKEIYGLETNQFHKIDLVCLSPNHWEGNNVGNKHYFFMLQGAKCPTSIRSFHNENLIPELAAHRKVLEVLGATTMIEPAKEQLSGLGYNHTVKDSVILRLSGSHKRVVKVNFAN